MAMERTFSIIKPDAVAKNVIGKITSRFEKAGLRIVASRMEHLTVDKAKGHPVISSHTGLLAHSDPWLNRGHANVHVG